MCRRERLIQAIKDAKAANFDGSGIIKMSFEVADVVVELLEEGNLPAKNDQANKRWIDADLFVRWTDHDSNGNAIDCYGTVEDFLTQARTMDGKRVEAVTHG